ncbi:MAG: hypothetical protein RRB13_15290 [bacterium]|nr:hypothetical protein [bacterium]
MTAQQIAQNLFDLDKSCRDELHRNVISDENDYTSTFCAVLRHGNYGPGMGQKLSRVYENKFGCDAMLVFRGANQVKVGVWEAKYPRLTQKTNNNYKYSWDYASVDRSKIPHQAISHFTHQLQRQAKAHALGFAAWEMFYNEHAVGTTYRNFDPQGSSCVWWQDAISYQQNQFSQTSLWNSDELNNMLSGSGTNLFHIVFDLLTCKQGEPFALSRDSQKLAVRPSSGRLDEAMSRVSGEDREVFMTELEKELILPIPTRRFDAEASKEMNKFIHEQGIHRYTYIDLGPEFKFEEA